jgi:prevent-host-death family protein
MHLNAVKSISFIKANAAEILENINESGQSMGITQHGEIKAVLMSADEYKKNQETMAFLKLVALGDEDIRTGKTRPVGEFVSFMWDKLAARSK